MQASLKLIVHVPLDPPESNRELFESDMASLVLGEGIEPSDQIRPEVAEELSRMGYDLELADISGVQDVGQCNGTERVFAASERLAKLMDSAGIPLSQRGAIEIEFEYTGEKAASDSFIGIVVELPSDLASQISGDERMERDFAIALLGDCGLPKSLQRNLTERNIDLSDVAERVYGDSNAPPTSRVSVETTNRLREVGVLVNQFGNFHMTFKSAN